MASLRSLLPALVLAACASGAGACEALLDVPERVEEPNLVCDEPGACRCTAGFGDCNEEGVCDVELQTNANHCGGCGKQCGDGQPCEDGACVCLEAPCKLIPPQCGCPEGEACSVGGRDETARECVPAGEQVQGESCGGLGEQCAPGNICLPADRKSVV